jgi:hypothetical protein
MLKKVLIGCGIFVLLCIVLMVACTMWAYNTGKGFVDSGRKMASQYESTNTQFPFDESASTEVTGEQLDRWLSVRERLAPEAKTFEQQLIDKAGANPLSVPKLMLKQSEQFVREHVASLEINGMSYDEYLWVTNQVGTAMLSAEARSTEGMDAINAEFEEVQSRLRDNNNDLRTMIYADQTAEQSQALLALLKAREALFVETMDLFAADYFVISFIEIMMSMGRSGAALPPATFDTRAMAPA